MVDQVFNEHQYCKSNHKISIEKTIKCGRSMHIMIVSSAITAPVLATHMIGQLK